MWFGYWIICALHCPMYLTERRTILSTMENIDNNFLDLCETILIKTLLFGSNSFNTNANTNVLLATIEYVLFTERFEEPLFQWSDEILKQGYESGHSVSIAIVTYLFFIICRFFFQRIFFIPGYHYNLNFFSSFAWMKTNIFLNETNQLLEL